MNTELYMLTLTAIFGLVQILVAAGLATKQRGTKWNFSSREGSAPALTGMAGRAARASENFKETFPLFLAAVVILQFQNQVGLYTAAAAQLYFWGRVIYYFMYLFNVIYVRTLVWGLATLGIVIIFMRLFGFFPS